MTTIPNAADDVTKGNTPTSSPLEQPTTSSTPASSNRFSFGSNETGESSTVASKRNSLTTAPLDDGLDGMDGGLDAANQVKDGRGSHRSHRSHRSRNSGGFLLSNVSFESPSNLAVATAQAHHNSSHRDHKGKAALRTPEKTHTKRRLGFGLKSSGSPLATNVTTTGTNGLGGDSMADQGHGIEDASGTKPTATALDVDSAQIVSLALNLSESRRNAARRKAASPLPPVAAAFGESFAGGSLRQHLQQQRRISRNVSPKPDRGDRAMASSRAASGQKINSPLQPAFESHPDGAYQYHFSASTLARAEKAKNAIELMAQYRRLLQYLPPLRPQTLEKFSTTGSSGPESLLTASRSISTNTTTPRKLGREYNPLQYIRNRKVRARERRAIDGEAQGFGDVDKVSTWVDQVAKEASSEEYQAADCLFMPTFSTAADIAASPHNSPPSTLSKNQASNVKIKRPRIDWVTIPADLIADVFWLEQDDNKKSIEDRFGRMIFPQRTELKRPMSRRSGEPEIQQTHRPVIRREETKSPDLIIDTKLLPEFRSVRPGSEKVSDSTSFRARQKLRETTRTHRNHNGLMHQRSYLGVRSHSPTGSDSSDSEVAHFPRRRRDGTAGSHDHSKDILEKQMMEMLAREARDTEWGSQDMEGKNLIESIKPQKRILKDGLEKSRNNNLGVIASKENPSRRDSIRNDSSGRPSLEIPGYNPRGSFEELDSTAPNSPLTKATKVANSYVPSLAMDWSLSTRSRPSSPTRNPLLRVKSKINQLQEHRLDRSQSRTAESESPITVTSSNEVTPDRPETPERQRRSMSPAKKILSKRTDDSSKSSIKKAGSIRKGNGSDEASGIRGLFKGSRNHITRVNDFIWKKEASGTSMFSGFSTDDSDPEYIRATAEKEGSRNNSITTPFSDVDDVSPRKEKPSYLSEMPVFRSPSEGRGRPIRTRSEEISGRVPKEGRQAREAEERGKSSRARFLDVPPRIDVQNASPTSSPDLQSQDLRDSSASDLGSRRGSFANGVHNADARLNAILGIPGRKGSGLPVTGLFALETRNGHRPSVDSRRHWSIYDRGVSVHRGPMTKREIARVRALLLSSGIKAKEISRRAAELKDLRNTEEKPYSGISPLAKQKIGPVPKSQEHILAARILSDDIQFSTQMWQASMDNFTGAAVSNLLDRIENLQGRLVDNLTPMTRKAADEADDVSKDLNTSQTLQVKRIMDTMDKMMRQRRRRLRWLRRGGWVLVEWALVGVMWLVWFLVVFVRVVMGIGQGVTGMGRWLLFR